MIFDEFHKIVRLNGWVQIRQMSTSHIIYKKENGHTLYHTIKVKKSSKALRQK